MNPLPSLPILDCRSQILDSLKNGNNLIVKAPTGSGKSTQVPQFLLDCGLIGGNILILQPRRLAARMLAARVAFERSVGLGSEIGFQTRFETLVSDATRACFITEGILPRMLLSNRDLSGVSAVIFDEFHERNLATDIGLSLVRDLQRTGRPDILIIAMSATIDTGPLSAFLGNAPVIECTGRTFPIDIRFSSSPTAIPIWDRAADAVASLLASGAQGDIVAFMPGVYEIRRTIQALDRAVRREPVVVLALYGDLPAARQAQVMEPQQRRKIIVATNIAETSLTIPGIRHVIDSGLARVNRYDPGRGFNTLFIEPISADSADQRAGRAGREAPGICIRLWSASNHAGRSRSTTPEVNRVDLAEPLLHVRMLGYDDATRPFSWFEEPKDSAVRAGVELLSLLGALDQGTILTDTGKNMSLFPMHPRLARMLLEAGKRNAVRLATFSAALLSERSALLGKPDYPETAYHCESMSDVYGHYCLLEKARTSGFDPAQCNRLAINASAAQAIFRTQALFLQYCRRFGMHTRDSGDATGGLCRSLLAAYPDHLCVRKDSGTLFCAMRDNRRGELAKDSIIRKARLLVAADIREIKTHTSELKTILSLSSEIKEQWLHEDFPSAWSTESRIEWNPVNKAIEAHTQTVCLGVTISDMVNDGVDPAKASALLAETILSKGMEISTWDQGATEWLKRVRWVGCLFPEQQLPSFSDDDRRLVVQRLCEGERQYERVRVKPVLPLLQGILTPRQRGFIEEIAPSSLVLPSGRKMRIFYEPGSPPRGRAKIQDLFGLRETPKIAAGRASVLIEILAPNNRPVQITDDLKGFWEKHYPQMKKTLSRRYPKHEWR